MNWLDRLSNVIRIVVHEIVTIAIITTIFALPSYLMWNWILAPILGFGTVTLWVGWWRCITPAIVIRLVMVWVLPFLK